METKTYTILDAIKHLRENSPKRSFVQSFDVAVNISNIDLKKPENKISKEIILPHARSKKMRVCIISDNIKNLSVDGAEVTVLGKSAVTDFESNKNAAKKFSATYDFFIAEAALMPLVGKVLGRHLGPRGKMPKLLPPGRNPENFVKEAESSVRLRIKDSPVIHCVVGDEKMSDEQINENIEKVVDEVKKALPGKSQIKNVYLKLTMGMALKLGVR
ncbi:MAG: 50S ribosomal protein L1 [Candidatus Aenigmarchaeota archaeon]|nr:50S ribosomal protein L1 [Candidatus Aenigmarchaeota archaeon]